MIHSEIRRERWDEKMKKIYKIGAWGSGRQLMPVGKEEWKEGKEQKEKQE